ncbi:hypothetical protein DVH24_029912 [Malus domestica]|uniref:Uncharacterized protein n=1 Tax=Malus domestica TaxID=3750 RepID=A0A498I190_MALDO|nr:hypothetical protein DVH24_029912 [Malus domestica]
MINTGGNLLKGAEISSAEALPCECDNLKDSFQVVRGHSYWNMLFKRRYVLEWSGWINVYNDNFELKVLDVTGFSSSRLSITHHRLRYPYLNRSAFSLGTSLLFFPAQQRISTSRNR